MQVGVAVIAHLVAIAGVGGEVVEADLPVEAIGKCGEFATGALVLAHKTGLTGRATPLHQGAGVANLL